MIKNVNDKIPKVFNEVLIIPSVIKLFKFAVDLELCNLF